VRKWSGKILDAIFSVTLTALLGALIPAFIAYAIVHYRWGNLDAEWIAFIGVYLVFVGLLTKYADDSPHLGG
jgi:hypothetical protein